MQTSITHKKKYSVGASILASSVLVLSILVQAVGAGAQGQQASFANSAFQRVWERTDLPVAQGRVNRTWLWGPTPGQTAQEPFKEGPGGQHLVQYFDKARMEINNPAAN